MSASNRPAPTHYPSYNPNSRRRTIYRGPPIHAGDGVVRRTIYTRGTHDPYPTQRVPVVKSSYASEFEGAFKSKNIDLRGCKKLGVGRYSKVYLVEQTNSDGCKRKIAMKMINESKQSSEYVTKFLPREVECWKKLHHPHVVKLLGHYTGRGHTFLTMEYGQRGDLLTFVQKNGAVAEQVAKVWISQVIQGVDYIHTMGMAHRDLKLENVVIFEDGIVKVSDFGFVKPVGNYLSNTHCGSKSYSAPEILSGLAYNPYKADTWAVGMMLFIMVTNQMPFREDQPNTRIIEIQRNKQFKFPATMSTACHETIFHMLAFLPQDRPGRIAECLQFPWFK